MFVTFAGGYNRKPNMGLDDLLGQADGDLAAGLIDRAAYEGVADEFVQEILDEMAVVGIAIGGDGGVRAPDRVLPWITGLEGLTAGEATTLPGGEAVTRPGAAIAGDIRWAHPLFVRDWTFADEASGLLVKQTLVGPYSLAALAEPASDSRRAGLALAFAEAQREELGALREAGCPMIEVDEPAALRIGTDAGEWRALRAAHERLTAGLTEGDDAPHLALGLWGGEIDVAGHATLLDLPYLSYLVDVLAGPSAWRFIAAVPPERGIVAGSADASSEAIEEIELHIWAMAWAAQGGRGSARVGLAPNGPLFGVGRHYAHRKCLRMNEAVNWANMGPLQDVAESIETPATSAFPELRAMAEAVEAGRRARGGV